MTNDKAVAVLRQVANELRTYNPLADEYKGVHIHPGWAANIEKAIASLAERAATQPAGSVRVCPERDIECGSRPMSWCKSCPRWAEVRAASSAPISEASARRKATDTEVAEWAERHSIANKLGSSARDAFEDAESLHMTFTQQEAKAEQAAPSSEGSGELKPATEKEMMQRQIHNHRRTIEELQRVYDERGLQIGRMEVALERATKPTIPDASAALEQQPIVTIDYWADAYQYSMGGGHAMVVKMLREYSALRKSNPVPDASGFLPQTLESLDAAQGDGEDLDNAAALVSALANEATNGGALGKVLSYRRDLLVKDRAARAVPAKKS